MEEYLEIASGLDENALIEFIKKKGNDRKKNLCEITRYQTEDYVRATEQHRHNTDAAKIRGTQKVAFEQRCAHMKADVQQQDNLIAELSKKIANQGSDKNNKQDVANQALNQLNNVLSGITQKSCVDLCKYFETENNASLVKGLECFVALLRGHKTANNVDVELYLKSHDKLLFKLKRADVEHLSLPIIQCHKSKLNELKKAFCESSHPDHAVCSEYYAYIKWAELYCDYAEAQIVANADRFGSDIIKTEMNKAEQNKAQLEEMQNMWKDNGIVAFYNDSKSDLDERLKTYEAIVLVDEKQA